MENKAGDQSIVRIANQKTIIEYLREKGPMSKADLAKTLKISKPTVAKNVEELILKKILYEYGEGISSGGRKPLLISFNKTYKYILSLEINCVDVYIFLSLYSKLISTSQIIEDFLDFHGAKNNKD